MSEKANLTIKDDTLVGRLKAGKFSQLQKELEIIVAKKVHSKIEDFKTQLKNPQH